MADCEHLNKIDITIKKEFMDHVFEAKGKSCKDCGAELWDDELNSKFKTWMSGLGIKHKIQFKVSDETYQCFEKLQNKFPGSNESTMIRSLIMVYLQLMSMGPEISSVLNQTMDTEYFDAFETGVRSKVISTQVNPLYFYDLKSWSELYDLKPNELAAEAFFVILAFCFASDQSLQRFWKSEILPKIEEYLKISA